MRERTLLLAAVLLGLAACGERDPDMRDTLTQAQRDSAIANSGLPAADAVARSLGVADSARARQARIDSVSR